MTAPTACMHPDWEWTGSGYKCKTAGCERMSADHRHPGAVTFGEPPLAAGSTSPVLCRSGNGVLTCRQPEGHSGDHRTGGPRHQPHVWLNEPAPEPVPAPKPDWTLFPWVGAGRALEAVQYGAKKYTPGDWRTRYTRAQLMAKVMRHLTADLRGEHVDAESGIPHVACACADLLFLLELEPGKGGNVSVDVDGR
jgi:hypothetical protein